MEESKNFLDQVFSSLRNKIDLEDIGKNITQDLLQILNAEGCELSILEDNKYFERIFFSLIKDGNILNDQSEVEKIFGEEDTKYEGSLSGNIIKSGKPFIWCESKGEDFEKMIQNLLEDNIINADAARIYYDSIPSKKISNFVIIPLNMPKEENDDTEFRVYCCLNIFNVLNGSTDKDNVIMQVQNVINVLDILSIFLFQAIFYKRAKDEINSNKDIELITRSCSNVDELLQKVTEHISKKLRSPLSSVWFIDNTHNLLVLHSLHLKPEYCTKKMNEQEVKDFILTKLPKVLKIDESFIGNLINDDFLQRTHILEESNYKWKELIEIICTTKLLAFPIKAESKTIAILVFHPELKDHLFERVNLNYFLSFTNQISTTLNYFIEKNFSTKARLLPSKLTEKVKKSGEISYSELAYKIKDIIGAEACSIFEAKGFGSYESGIYLRATTDSSRDARNKIDQKVYDINSDSITGYCACKGKPLIVYDISKVQEIYPEIIKASQTFVEKTERPHTSCIVVPIPEGINLVKENPEPVLIIRCINKKAESNDYKTELFTEIDKHLLNFLSLVYQSYKKVYEILKERRELINLIVHETRNPITSIQSKIDIVLDKEKKIRIPNDLHKVEQKLQDIDYFVKLLNNLVGNMDFLNNLMQGRIIYPRRSKVKIWNDVIENVIYWMKPQFYDNKVDPRNVELVKNDRRSEINVDQEHLIYVFYNLFSNSIKYKDPDTAQKIQVLTEVNDKGLNIKINDWGIGVDVNETIKIFERGFRGKYAYDNNVKGRGFGLWLCHELLKANGLEIKVTSEKKPTTFRIFVPKKYIIITKGG